jgi:hypothetical protein
MLNSGGKKLLVSQFGNQTNFSIRESPHERRDQNPRLHICVYPRPSAVPFALLLLKSEIKFETPPHFASGVTEPAAPFQERCVEDQPQVGGYFEFRLANEMPGDRVLV